MHHYLVLQRRDSPRDLLLYGGIGVRLTFVTIDKRAKLRHPVSCHAVFGFSLPVPFIKRFQNMVQTVTNVSQPPFPAKFFGEADRSCQN